MKTLRIFPRKTRATPDDENVIIGRMPELFDTADKIEISVTFTWDIPGAEKLFKAWSAVAPCEIGGPALNTIGHEFIPGKYLKKGFTITSRGCPNKCWFCNVWKRDGNIRELPINDGNIIQDDNLLSCSENHIRQVFEMLKRQKEPISFSGGIEAKLIQPWHVELFKSIRMKELFCAYDTPDDLDPLMHAGKLLNEAGISIRNRKARCYVLIGHPRDTFDSAEKRIHQTIDAGFFPFAMLWKNERGEENKDWRRFQRQWSNNVIAAVNVSKYLKPLP